MCSENILVKIKSELTQELWGRLLAHAAQKLKYLSWHGVLGGPPSCGLTAADFVQTAIEKTWEGTRRWKSTEETLEKHLRGCIDSEISHAVDKRSNWAGTREASLVGDSVQEDASGFDAFEGNSVSPETAEIENILDETVLKFHAFLEEAPLVQKLFELIYDGKTKRADQAQALNISVTDLDALRKRLETFRAKFAKQNETLLKEIRHV